MEKQTKRKYCCTHEQLEEKAKNLQIIVETFLSNKNDIEKAFVICKFYKKSEIFRKSYHLINEKGQEDYMFAPYIANFSEIYNFYLKCEKDGTLDLANYLVKNEAMLHTYPYASFILNKYINDENSYQTDEFLEELGITENEFELCLNVVEETDLDLYNEYLKRKEQNKKTKFSMNKRIIEDISKGISTGYLEDGTKFSVLEFMKRFPFKDASNPFEKFRDFMKQNTPEHYMNVLMYMSDNKISDRYIYTIVKEETIRSIKTTINGRLVTEEDNDIILAYIKQNNYPLYPIVFRLARKEYLDGNISEKDINPKKEEKIIKKTLIP